MKSLQEVLTKEYLTRLREMTIRLRYRLSTDGYSGARRSMAKGSSLEFSDYREYAPGDDLRRVDWNNYARFGKLYLKLFLEEKQASVQIFLDCSKSMEQEGKFLAAKQLAASFAYIGLQGGDRVNLYAFRDGIAAGKRNMTQAGRFLETVRFLDELEAKGGTEPLRAVLECGALGRGIAVVISDFMTDGKLEETVKLLQQKKQEVILLQVLSREEEDPQIGGAVRLVDAESQKTLDLELREGIVQAYQRALAEHRAALGEFCRRRDAVFCHVREDGDLLKTIYTALANG